MEITQEQDALIAHSLPVYRGNVGSSKRHVRNAFVSVVAHGGNWRGLPQGFGNWHTIKTPINRWSKAGVRNRNVATRQQTHILRLRIAAVSCDSIDSKVHPDCTGALKNGKQSLGQSSGGWTTKRHRIAAAAPTGVACCVSPGDPHDAPGGRGRMQPSGPVKQPIALVMERAFAGDDTRSQAQRLGYQPVVPPKSNRHSLWQYDGLLSRRRNDIDRLLRRLKRDRLVFTRYDT